MHVEKKSGKVVNRNLGGHIVEIHEHSSEELVLDEGDTVDNLTEEQKDQLLQAAFLPHGDRPDPMAAPEPVRTVQEYKEIQEDVQRLYPKTAAPLMESSMHVATDRLVGPPTEAPRESRVRNTPVEEGSDNLPPDLR